MGRGKIEIKRIENTNNRQVTYSKRRNGLIKKAKEISVLCDAQVSLVIFASSGKMHDYISPSTNLVDLLEKYHEKPNDKPVEKLWDANHENLSIEIDRIKKENQNLQIDLAHLKGEEIKSLPEAKLTALEEALYTGLARVREKKMDYIEKIRRTDHLLENENNKLHLHLQQQEIAMEGSSRAMENRYNHHVTGDYKLNMPFEIRLAPLQPNLQEMM